MNLFSKKTWLFALTLIQIFFCFNLFGQSHMDLDSLLNLEIQIGESTEAIDLFIAIGQQYENHDIPKAKYYYKKAEGLSKKLNLEKEYIRFIHNYTFLLNLEGKFDSSLYLNRKAMEMSMALNDTINLFKALVNTGSVYRQIGDYKNAISHILEGKKYLEIYGDEIAVAQLNDQLQLLYSDLRQHQKAISHGVLAVEYLRKSGEWYLLAIALNNLGLNYINIQEYQKAKEIFDEIIPISQKLNDKLILGSAYLNLSDIAIRQQDYRLLWKYNAEAVRIYEELGTPDGLSSALRGSSILKIHEGKLNDAKKYAEASYRIAKENRLRAQQQNALITLGNIYYMLHEINQAEKFHLEAGILQDSLIAENVQQEILNLERKYESEKMMLALSRLEAEKKLQESNLKRQKLTIWTLIISTGLLMIIIFIYYRYHIQKQKLKDQQIQHLETEKILTATESLWKGEEKERSRIAKELHDGLGSLLSGLRFSIQSINGENTYPEKITVLVEKSLSVLDKSISELRSLAHNLIPEALEKLGLKAALGDFCGSFASDNSPKIKFQAIGWSNEKIDPNVELTVFRIAQELINNSIKHANASEILVQLTKDEAVLLLDIEDNGIGFDPEINGHSKGMGWSNIRTRINYLQAKLNLQTEKGKGTSVHIEVPLPKNSNLVNT